MRLDERQKLGLRVRKLREQRGLSQASLGRLSGHCDRWVLDLESGRVDPKLSYLLDLARALRVKVEAILSQDGSNDVAPRTLEAKEDQEAQRREFLALLAAAGVGMVDVERLTASLPNDARLLDDLECALLALKRQWYGVPASALLPAATGLLGSMKALAPGSPRLAALTAETAILTGQLLKYSGRHGDAYTHHHLAASLAREVGADDTQALAHVLLAGMFSWRYSAASSARALAMLDRAGELTSPASPLLLRVVLLVTRAGELATVGDERSCLRDLEAAERALRPSQAHFYGPRVSAEVAACRGACELVLRRHQDAITTFDYVLTEMDPAAVSWRMLVAADRDTALAAL